MSKARGTPKEQSMRNALTRPSRLAREGDWMNLPAQPFWRLMLGILLFALVMASSISLVGGSDLMRELPVTLHSNIQVSYSADPILVALQPVKMDLVGDALNDQAGEAGSTPVVQLATLINDLTTPVPSVTPLGTPIPPTPAGPGGPTPAVILPLPTGAASETLAPGIPTATPGTGQTATQAPSPTRKPSVPPGQTATPHPEQATLSPTSPIKPSPGAATFTPTVTWSDPGVIVTATLTPTRTLSSTATMTATQFVQLTAAPSATPTRTRTPTPSRTPTMPSTRTPTKPPYPPPGVTATLPPYPYPYP